MMVLSGDFDTDGSYKVAKVSKVFVNKTTVLVSIRKVDSWTVPLELFLVQTFPVYIMHLRRSCVQICDVA